MQQKNNFTNIPNLMIISVACPIGTKVDSNSCLYCDVGSYQDETGQVDCKQCPTGFSTSIIGASDVSNCTGIYYTIQMFNQCYNLLAATRSHQENMSMKCIPP